jgi:hypothetical protein
MANRMLRVLGFLLASVAALLLPTKAWAFTDENNTTVTVVYVAQDGVLIQLASGTSAGCPDNSYAIIRFGASYPNAAQQVNIALSAYLSGRTVNVRLNGCATTTYMGGGGYPVVSFISVH